MAHPWRPAIAYFATPVPRTEGFSAYRMPGPAFHLTVFALTLATGSALCLGHPVMAPFLLVWAVAGIYLGRDLAIVAHYVPPLALLGLAVFFTFPFFAGSFASVYRVVAAAGQQHPAAGVLATAGMAALLAVRVWRVVASTER